MAVCLQNFVIKTCTLFEVQDHWTPNLSTQTIICCMLISNWQEYAENLDNFTPQLPNLDIWLVNNTIWIDKDDIYVLVILLPIQFK